MQWVDIVENSNGKFEDSDGRYDIIYAKTKREQINTRLRMNIAFNPKMTFEAFYQPFNVDMDYKDYYRLNEERTFNTGVKCSFFVQSIVILVIHVNIERLIKSFKCHFWIEGYIHS